MKYSASIRWIHLILALFITVQLSIGEIMDVPGEDDHPAQLTGQMLITPAYAHENHVSAAQAEEEGLFEVHEIIGLSLIVVLLLRWFLAGTSTQGGSWRVLFPWLSKSGREDLIQDIKTEPKMWLQGELPVPSDKDAIAKTVHGLMILTVTGMVLTGLALYFGWNEHGKQTELIEMIGGVHGVLAGLMWALVGGHVFMALLHQKLGHRLLQKMRPFGAN